MELVKLLGQRTPYSMGGMLTIYITRVLPFICSLAIVAWLFAPQFILRLHDYVPDPKELGTFVLFAVFIAPIIETILFLIFLVIVPSRWYHSSSKNLSAGSRQVILCIVFGTIFGLLHLPNPFSVVAAFWGGAIMFAMLLDHSLCNKRDRGIVVCGTLHAVHNSLMLLLLVAFDWYSV